MDDNLRMLLFEHQRKTREDPSNPQYWIDYGDFLSKHLELYQDSIDAYKVASKLLPNSDLNLRIGEALFLDGDENGIKLIEDSIKNKPRPEAYTILANCLIESERLFEARENLIMALEIDEEYEEAIYLLGEIEEDDKKAIELLKSAIDIDESYQLAWGNLGKRQLKIGDFPGAIKALKKAIELDKDDIWSHLYIANAYWNIKDFTKADYFYSRAYELDPNSLLTKKWYLDFLIATGNTKKADMINQKENN